MPSFGTLGQLLNLPPFSGDPPIFWFDLNHYIYVMCKNVKPYNNPFWGFEYWYPQEINKEWKNSGHLSFLPAAKCIGWQQVPPIVF
jgi:hypothetical protein